MPLRHIHHLSIKLALMFSVPRRLAVPLRPARSGGSPSRTSQVVAVMRAGLDRPHTPGGDPRAQRRLSRGMRPAAGEAFLPSLAARTRFFDDQVLGAISAGTGQLVIL